ncbi:MAG TPA: hypothetical protein VM580_29500 [Labilithrix sp.]|nr:hypothetical protein [Labilithrix sp.]
MSVVRAAAVFAMGSMTLVFAAGCSEDPEATTTQSPAQPTPDDSVCTSQSADEVRDELPSGKCEANAQCRFSTPAGAAACKPGISAVAETPSQYHCVCAGGEWSCTVTAPGFGVVGCPGN